MVKRHMLVKAAASSSTPCASVMAETSPLIV